MMRIAMRKDGRTELFGLSIPSSWKIRSQIHLVCKNHQHHRFRVKRSWRPFDWVRRKKMKQWEKQRKNWNDYDERKKLVQMLLPWRLSVIYRSPKSRLPKIF